MVEVSVQAGEVSVLGSEVSVLGSEVAGLGSEVTGLGSDVSAGRIYGSVRTKVPGQARSMLRGSAP